MFSKNLRFYRLKSGMSMKQLASLVGVSAMTISYYESGERKPGMDMIRALAKALGVRTTDFLNNRNTKLVFAHGEFRKSSKLSIRQQEYIKESVEEYLGRFYSVIDALGGDVLPDAPVCHGLMLTDNVEENAMAMRKYLRISEFGPVGNLVELLENKGILIYVMELENNAFSGMNGSVNGRPYIIVNGRMSTERIRSTIAHELAHFIFKWPDDMEEKQIEKMATAISGAFLFPVPDAKRELGIRRTAITKDMILTCKEYGISMYLLVKRANLCGIVNDNVTKNFYIQAGQAGWKKHEPTRIRKEEPGLFMQLVFRAVSESEISIQKGAELLKQPYSFVEEQCFSEEGLWMEYISSDTNVWLDFMMIEQLELPFRLPYIYLMNEDAIHDELLSPAGLSENLLALGLVETELEEEEFFCAETYMESYPKLSVYDGVALAMAKCRRITLLTGDGPLRRAAQREGISVMGTIGILDQLYEGVYIGKEEYLECLNRLQKYNGGKIRLPKKELELRIRSALKAV